MINGKKTFHQLAKVDGKSISRKGRTYANKKKNMNLKFLY